MVTYLPADGHALVKLADESISVSHSKFAIQTEGKMLTPTPPVKGATGKVFFLPDHVIDFHGSDGRLYAFVPVKDIVGYETDDYGQANA